jgi:hypothetical protein
MYLFGSLTAVFLAAQLIKSFKGKGLVDAALVADPNCRTAHRHGDNSDAIILLPLIVRPAGRLDDSSSSNPLTP